MIRAAAPAAIAMATPMPTSGASCELTEVVGVVETGGAATGVEATGCVDAMGAAAFAAGA